MEKKQNRRKPFGSPVEVAQMQVSLRVAMYPHFVPKTSIPEQKYTPVFGMRKLPDSNRHKKSHTR